MHCQLPESVPSVAAATATTYDRAPSRSTTPAAPEWFHEALDRPYDIGSVDVAGATIRYLSWGRGTAPPVLLVHGGAAHAMWWGPIAATLAPDRRVVAMDLSGHGISDHRPTYTVDTWVAEIAAVATEIATTRPIVVGHSLGGILLSHAMVKHGRGFELAVLVDAPVWDRAPAPEGELTKVAGRRRRHYADLDAAMARFRLMPPQDCANRWFVDHIARHSLTRDPNGWQWRFDPRIFANPTDDSRIVRFSGDLDQSRCPWALVMGEHSYLTPAARPVFDAHPGALWRVVPDAAHHVMLDQPLTLQRTIRGLLAGRH